MGWREDLEEARRRVAALDPERELAEALKAATSERLVTSFSAFFLPLPPVARDIVSFYGDFTEDREHAERLHLDAHGRPVAFGRPHYVWFWDEDGGFLEIEFMGSGPHVRRYRREYLVTASAHGSQAVERLTWRDGHAVRSDGVRSSANRVRSFAAEADYAADGRLERVRRSFARDDTDDLDAGLERAASIAPERVIWDGRVSAPEPWPDDPEALVGPLAAALDRAVRDALADAPVEAPFVVEVIGGERSFVPQARIVGAAWRDLVRGRSQHDGAALSDLHEAVAHGHGVQVDLVDRLDAEALRACRAFTTAFDGTAIWTRDPYSDVVADDLGTRLSDLLNRMPVHGTADPFLALVEITGRFSDGRPGRERARWSAPQFERFMASVTSSRGRASVGTTVERALRDRDALQAYLSEGGLPEHAARLAHEVARMGFRLDGGRGRSRLGGRALLPPGEPCPVGERALTFLAGIDLGELPPSELPDQGWMLFFADLGDDDVGFCEEDDNRPGSMIRMFFTEEPVEAEPCSRDLAERRVLPTPFLMLPNGQAEREEAGLDVFESKTYAELVYALTEPTWADSPHWVGGWPTGPQGVVADSDTLLLLQIADDEELEFHYLDAGTIQFRIPPGALAERDWPRVRAIAESS